MLVVVAGQVASGKSTLARALARRIGAEWLEADRVRGTLLSAISPGASGAEARWRRDFSPGFEDEIYADLLRRADEGLAAGRSLVLDACFPRRSQRAAAREIAQRRGVGFLFVECRADDATIRARLCAREGDWEAIHRRLAGHFEPPDELRDGDEHLAVRTDGPIEPTIEAILARLRAGPGPAPPPGASPRIAPLPRAVSFDCWNTLLVEEDWLWAHSLRVSALIAGAREAGAEIERAAAERAFDAAWSRHHDGWLAGRATGAREVAEWGLAALGLGLPHPALEHLVRRFEEASHTSHVVALEGAAPLLHRLAASGVARVLVCDTGLTPGRVVRQLLDRVGLLGSLDALSFSDEVAVPKPDPRAFRAALEPLGIAPEDALHVGDLRRTDVAGARALGMRTVRIRARHDDRSPLPEADHVVDSHAELAGLLGLRLAATP